VICGVALTAAGFPSRRAELGTQGEDRLLLLLPAGIRPEFEVIALPHQMHLFFKLCEAAELRRDQHAARRIHLLVAGKTHEETLQQRRMLFETGARKHFVADRFPGWSGIDEEAAMGMSGQDQRASGQLCERVPMPRRNRQATLRIETERGCALKHASPTSSPERARKTHFFPLSSTSSHFRTKGIPGQAEPKANPFCAQALRATAEILEIRL
jgi:hypothetical protein